MNQNSYNSNSLGFDQPQPPQSPVIHQPPQEMSVQEMEDLKQQYLDELKRLKQWANLSTHPSKCLTSFCYDDDDDDDDDDEDYTSAITPDEPILSTEEPDNSLSMGDEHLDIIPATESDEVIKSSVENLILIPSESEGIPEHMCDVPFHDNSPPLDVSKDQFEDFSATANNYVEASPPDSELVSSEVMEIVIPEVGGIDDDILLTIKDDILYENLLNVNLLIVKIEALNANPTPSFDCKTKSSSTSLNSLLEETHTFDNSLPEFETFCFEVEPNLRDFTRDVVEDISPTKEPKVHNTLPTLQLILKFQPSSEYLFTYVVWIFLPFLVYSVAPHYLHYYLLSLKNEDTIFDPGICNSRFFRLDVSHRCGTFPRFKILLESPMEIFSSTCSPWTNEFGVDSGSRLG
nr:hypothetical protein [Tanacetum cinerariifolium]